MIAESFIRQGYPAYKVLPLCKLSRSSYYYCPGKGKRGRRPSTVTLSSSGILYSNGFVLDRIKWLLNQEFVDYGYEKVTGLLRNSESLIINEKNGAARAGLPPNEREPASQQPYQEKQKRKTYC